MSHKDAKAILDQIKDLCEQLEWDLFVDLDNGTFYGMIIGTPNYINDVVNGDVDFDEYTLIHLEEVKETLH